MAGTFDYSYYNKNFPALKQIIENLKNSINFTTIEKICSVMNENRWYKMNSITENKSKFIKILVEKIGNDMETISFGSLIHIQNLMVYEGKLHLISYYKKRLVKPMNILNRLVKIKSAEQIYNLGNIFMLECEQIENNNPVILIKYLCGKYSIHLESIKTMNNDEIIKLLKDIIKVFESTTLLYNFSKKLDACKTVKDLASFIIEERDSRKEQYLFISPY